MGGLIYGPLVIDQGTQKGNTYSKMVTLGREC